MPPPTNGANASAEGMKAGYSTWLLIRSGDGVTDDVRETGPSPTGVGHL
jgi:hypothetical protein